MSAAPAVSAHNDAQAFSRAEGVSPPPQWPGTCPRYMLHGDILVGSDRAVVAQNQPLDNAVSVNHAKLAIIACYLPN